MKKFRNTDTWWRIATSGIGRCSMPEMTTHDWVTFRVGTSGKHVHFECEQGLRDIPDLASLTVAFMEPLEAVELANQLLAAAKPLLPQAPPRVMPEAEVNKIALLCAAVVAP